MNLKGLLLGNIMLTVCTASATHPEKWLRDSIPGEWQVIERTTQTLPTDDEWWHTFYDPMLDRLISLAVANNYDVSAAVKRVDMARNALHEVKSGYYPTVNLNAGWSLDKSSGALVSPPLRTSSSSSFSLGADMNWEIDLFGRVKANAGAQRAAVGVARADYDGLMVSLCAKVATAYIQLRVYQKQLAVNRAHLIQQEKVVKITEARFEAELASMLDVTQARIVLYNTRSTLPSLQSNIRTLINTLSILVGEYPGALADELAKDTPLPGYHIAIDTGVPTDLLRRRPDIIEAEMTLAKCASDIGVAKKDYLPTLSLTGSIGTQAHDAGDLFGNRSYTYSVAPQLSWTLYEGNARKYRVAEAKLQMEAAIETYNATVMNAVCEVDNALQEYDAALQGIELQEKVVDESERSLDLAINLYKTGLTPFSNVSDAQINWLTSQNELVSLEGEALSSLIKIYQALGGGWMSQNFKAR